jgi:pyruvate dehydrogenase E2 component (dihydrolipoamide acetyltransferase)
MIKKIMIPEIGESVESGDVIRVLVSVGDPVSLDQPVIELETEKAVVEIPSQHEGKITEILVKTGDTVKIGQAIAVVSTSGAEDVANGKEDAVEKNSAEAPQEKTADEPAKSVRTENTPKAEPEVLDATAAGRPDAPEPEDKPVMERNIAPAAPSIRMLARELGADINAMEGSGPGGRITAEDVKNHVRRIVTQAGKVPRGAPVAMALPDFGKWGEIRREPVTKIRRITAENTASAWTMIPHVTQFDEADITEVEAFRKKYGEQARAEGGSLTMTVILLKVLAKALKRFPRFNASLDMQNQEIIYKDYQHISIAVDTEHGLLVPVIRDVDRKSLTELAKELTDLAEKARRRRIAPDDMEGGTFTITNQGGIGGVAFTPVIFWPQVAILGVSRASTKPVYIDGKLEPRMILPLTLSYDHRLIDGADAARFMKWIVDALRHPLLLSFEP